MPRAPRRATEDDFGTFVYDLAKPLGWRGFHPRPARTEKGWRTAGQGDVKGYPDWTLVRPPRLIFAELKTETGRLRPEQIAWLEALGAVAINVDQPVAIEAVLAGETARNGMFGVEVYVWRPSDVDEIREILR